MSRWSAVALLLALAGALALRIPKLDSRPLHNDEAVNAVKVTELWQHGRYAYDPDEYHGPVLHYATLPFLWLSGARTQDDLPDSALRVAPVLAGVALILLLLLFRDALGGTVLAWSSIFIAVSPAMVFYSRYFIHEMLLVFFTVLTLGAAWRYLQTRSMLWAATAGAGVGLMFATKETFVINLAAAGVAAVITLWWSVPKGERIQRVMALGNWRQAAPVFLAAFILVWLVFFSSFFTHFDGLLDSARTYLPWLKRAGGQSPHIHPWNFYLERLVWFHPVKGVVWSEGLILVLAVIGVVAALTWKRSPFYQFLALYTLVLTALYSAISYKTPWCLLNFYVGMIVLAGLGAVTVVECFKARWLRVAVVSLILGFTFQLAWQSWRASVLAWGPAIKAPAYRQNPYAYAQTVPDLLNLVQRTDGIGRMAPAAFDSVVKVIAPQGDYWPLPWYLRRFKKVGWYENVPPDPYAPIIIVSAKLNARLDDKSERKWIMVGLNEMRPGKFFEEYVELELWKKYVESLPRERE